MRISSHTQYSGYSEEVYDGYQRFSQYVTMPDGCRLAVDIYRPTKNGVLHTEPLPVLWNATPYRRGMIRASGKPTTLKENLWFAPEGIDTIMRHGYIIGSVDLRGSGASFGQRSLCTLPEDFEDLYNICEWFGTQPWSTGKTGMFGCSYLGQTQWETALMAPPHLTCIVPNVAAMHVPTQVENGMFNDGWLTYIDESCRGKWVTNPAWPVDEDTDGALLAAAVEDHKKCPSTMVERTENKFFDGVLPWHNKRVYQQTWFPNFIHKLNSTNIACYLWGGWADFFAYDVFQWYATLKTPKKLMVGPWYHIGSLDAKDPDWTTDHLRWYDYWLKGIENGIMDEPPIRLFNCLGTQTPDPEPGVRKPADETKSAFGAPPFCSFGEWRDYEQLPVPGMAYENFYLRGGSSGTVDSLNDGVLTAGRKPEEQQAADTYTVDYSVSKAGHMDRHNYAVRATRDYTEIDRKSATYTTPPLAQDMELTGQAVVHLWVSTDAKDVDFYCYLEEIDENGRSCELQEARLRSGFRGTVEPPFDNMGMPWHRYCERDYQPMPRNTAVSFDLAFPFMSNTVKAGHRLRLTINHADKGNWDTPELDPAPQVSIYRDREHLSYLALPVVHKKAE